MKVDIPVTANTKDAVASIASLQTKMQAIAGKLSELRIGATTKDAEAAILRLQAKLAAMARQVSSITMSADTTRLDASIAAEQAKLAKLRQQAGNLKMDADTKAAVAKIAALEKQAFHLEASLEKLEADVDINAALTKIYAIEAELKVLRSNAEVIRLAADSRSIDADITAVETRIADLQHQAGDIKLGANIDVSKLLSAEAGLLGIETAMDKLPPAVVAGDIALGALGKAIAGTGTGWGFLTRNITLFGGAFNRVLPVVAASVAVWHVLADVIVELGAVWIPATLAVGAFAIAASDAAVEIQRRMQAVHTVMDATGQSVPPMTSAMENLHKAVRPEVYQLFGEALTVMNSRTGTFAQVAKATGTVLDQLGARIVFAVTANNKLGTSTTQLSGFWKTAITDVSKLGDSIGNVFGIFGNFFKAIPGFAAGLLTIGDDFTKILETASAAAVPVLKFVLLLHGYILYTGLAVTGTLAFIGGVANLAKQFFTFAAGSVVAGVGALKSFGLMLAGVGRALLVYITNIAIAGTASGAFAAALAPLAANPMIWVAAAAIALGALVFAIIRSRDAAQQFNSTMQQTIANASLSSVVSVIQNAQAATTARLAASTRQLSAATTAYAKAEGGRYTASALARTGIQNLTGVTDHYQAGLAQLSSQQQVVTGRFAGLTKQYGSGTAALGLLNAAGITGAQITDTQGHAWAEALIQISATVQAYTAMGTQAGVLGNDLDVLGRTVTDQYQAVQKLNQGWSAFISDVTGTQGAFDTMALGLVSLSQANQNAGIKLSTASARVATAQNTLNRLQGSGTATSLQLTAAQDRLSAAQNRLQQVQQAGTPTMDGLNQASLQLNQAFGTQVQNTDKLFASWRTAGLAGNLFTAGVKASIAPLVKYASGSQEATAQLVALAQEAGYQGPVSLQALTKWLGNTHGATQKLKDITNQATVQEALLTGAMQAQGSFIAGQLIGDINNAILKYDHVRDAAKAYGDAIAQSGRQSDAARGARQTLINDLIKSGQAAGDSKGQIAAMIAKVLGIPPKEALQIVMTGTGSFSLSQINAKTGKQQQAASGGYLNPAGRLMRAAGGYIHMGSGPVADDVPIMASRGEYVVQAKSVSKYGKAAMDRINAGAFAQGGLIPGYASGGLLERGDLSVLSGQYAVDKHDAFKAQMQAAMVAQMRSALKSAITAATQAAQAAASPPPGAVSGAIGNLPANWHAIASYLASHGFARPWAAGVGGNIFAESGGNPNIWEAGGGGGYGLIQWTPPPPGLVGSGLYGELNQIVREGTSYFNGAATPSVAALEYLMNRERPANPAATAGIREASANAIFKAMGWAHGGLVGMASGGTVASLRAKLAGEQAGERAKYFGLAHSFAIGPRKYLTTATRDELVTLAKRQATEQGAYAALAGAGLTTSSLHHLGATARSELGTAGDKALSRLPGGHPLFAADLRKYLGQLSATGSGSVPAGGSGTPFPSTPAGIAALRKALAGAQAGERHKFFGLEHSFAIGPAKYRTKTVTGELATLAKRQGTELAAYSALSGKGLTQSALSHFGATARSEMGTAADQGLSKMPGGHPLYALDLRRYLATLSTLAGTKVTAPGGGGTGGGGGTTGPPQPSITHTYGAILDTIEAFLQSHAAPFGAARGGRIGARSYDRGGMLPTGLSMAWNGTGRPEPVGGGGCVTVEAHLHVHGPVGSATELEDWLVKSVNKASQLGRLKHAMTRSVSAQHTHPGGGFGQ